MDGAAGSLQAGLKEMQAAPLRRREQLQRSALHLLPVDRGGGGRRQTQTGPPQSFRTLLFLTCLWLSSGASASSFSCRSEQKKQEKPKHFNAK